MTEALITTENFMGLEIRIVGSETDHPAIPLTDIANATGYDPSNLTKLYKRNQELLKENAQMVKLASGAQVAPISHICLEREGVIGILMKLDYVRIKDPERKRKIVEFQRWAKQRLAEMQIQSKIVKDHGEGWSSVAMEHINFANLLSQHSGITDPGMCLAIGIREAEKATGVDLTAYKKLIPPAQATNQEEYFTAGRIGKEVGRTAREVNRYLETTGFLYQAEDGTYYLTNKGSEYGKLFPGAFGSGHCGYFIMWRRSIIAAARMKENSPYRIRE